MAFDAKARPATYCGDDPALKGKTALVTRQDDTTVLAQFDNLDLGNLAFSWHPFPATAFEERKVSIEW